MAHELKSTLADDGVVLLRNVIPEALINAVSSSYDALETTLSNQDIPHDRPIVVFWRHVAGETKRIADFGEMPALWRLIRNVIVPALYQMFPDKIERLQLLETIIFDKPPMLSNTLNWHQDVAYFPLKPNNQIAVWIPFNTVIRESGAMCYAIGSHKMGIRGSTNLHTREAFANENRPLIPEDPQEDGHTVKTFEMTPCDMLVHDGYTWHYSGPNQVAGRNRRGLSVRFMTEPAAFDPRPGQGAAFTHQMEATGIAPGELIKGAPFPEM